MPHHLAFCSACDRPVPVDLKHDSPAARDAADVVCLEYPARCTGAMCPLFTVNDVAGDAAGGPRTSAADRHRA
jgi:hypothetical protein